MEHHRTSGEEAKEAEETSLRALARLRPGAPVDLAAIPSDATPGFAGAKAAGRAETAAMGAELAALQERLYAAATGGDRRRLLLVLQGMDTSGKGGTVKHVAGQVNPSGCRIQAFKAPTEEERAQHFLWRVTRALPKAGEIGVFDRSHYEDVLVVRVHGLVPEPVWTRRYDEINAWERALADDGVTFVKVFLHIGHEEQRERLLARLDKPHKHWKFDAGDIEERRRWPEYQRAYAAALERCSTDAAPWYVVPADRKWYRNWAVSRLLLEHLRALDPPYPTGDFDVAAIRARLRAEKAEAKVAKAKPQAQL
ncbi:polyphosphate kinase 2 family protein [Streptomyces sp. NBC_01803]|uniref:polyphosphate kinase 2 family protein n=1 Tax=Streptomyces sp. NBC_01803 TaxID=2975946 RepID=UPI002DD83FBF|nr:polyphosphate kinase 2 family protein [Streptomyces sp. NBC_01803]WSA43791.1 polyphosphate kinase 2 family protein [Streptomyces sp. NBC_01803]